jgi:hypothetical protein
LSLVAAGVAILALLFASYSRRSTWLALGSTTLSVALIGCLLLATSRDPSQLRMRFAWIANALPLVLERQNLDDLATAIERASTSLSCDAGQRPECGTAASAKTPPAGREAMQAASTTSWFGSKPESKTTSDSPVTWRLGDPHAHVSSSSAEGFLIGGSNVSDQALEEVRAVLKPDSSQRELAARPHR